MSRIVSRAENWETVYQSFANINFAAFDYNTVKQSLIEYIKLYFPESFNDFIESSELISIIEVFAYIAQLFAYRLDVNAHENFISTAERRDAVLRLAKLISYKADRPLPARGLVKLQSVSTTEPVYDSTGTNLANRVIRWNDTANPNWKDQFIQVINRVLERQFGSVLPSERFQIEDVVFELYGLNMTPLPTGVFRYNANVSSGNVPMELVPVDYDTSLGIVERRPTNNSNFTLLYGSDGLGDASNTTGFFCYTKQGSLQKFTTTFDGITPNQTFDVNATNVNDTDVWLNNIDPDTGEILDTPSILPYRPTNVKSGEWQQVDLAHSQNVIFNTNPARNKYEVETLDGNRIRLVFGDGEFADIPKGTFNIWARTSVDEDLVVSQTAVINTSSSFTYVDSFGRTQTFTFTYSLINSLQNASAAETIEHIKQTAPAVYYTQDRMVNGEDYNVFPLQDSSILKLRAVNRTFAGDSKYIAWHDPSGYYENVKMFSNDGIMYFQDSGASELTPIIGLTALRTNYLEPLIASTDIFNRLVSMGVAPTAIRKTLNANEVASIDAALNVNPMNVQIVMWYDTTLLAGAGEWVASAVPPGNTTGYPTLIQVTQPELQVNRYLVTRFGSRIVFQSEDLRFWNINNGDRVIDYDTLRTNFDQIVLLQANGNSNRSGLLTQDWQFDIVGLELIDSGPYAASGVEDTQRVNVIAADLNGDGVPDNTQLTGIINPSANVTLNAGQSTTVTFPLYFIAGDVSSSNGSLVLTPTLDSNGIGNSVNVFNPTGGVITAAITLREYVYFNRLTIDDVWVPQPTQYQSIESYNNDIIANPNPADRLWTRRNGRDNLNFAWFHFTPYYHLTDPAPSNIIDAYIITKGYYKQLQRWLTDPQATAPVVPTPLQLRTDYSYLFDNKMISDTIIPHPAQFKLLFGPRSIPQLQAKLLVVRSDSKTLTDNQIKTTIVATVRDYFDISKWEFGETFYFSELSGAIHSVLRTEISSVILVPTYQQDQFGDMYEVLSREDQIFYADISVDQIEIVAGYNATNMRLNG